MAARVEIKGDRISLLQIVVGFLPLAFGYFLSVLFQSIDPLVADDLTSDLALGKGSLGMLTAAFPLAFALCLLPSGIAFVEISWPSGIVQRVEKPAVNQVLQVVEEAP